MIVIRIQGGLGNQMFQHALGASLAWRHNVEVAYDVSSFATDALRDYALDVWGLKPRMLTADEQRRLPKRYGGQGLQNWIQGRRPWKHLRERPPYRYDGRFLALQDHSYYDGYWQSEQYFIEVNDQLRADFQPAVELSQETRALVREVESCNSIAVHVRRGDYLKLPAMQSCDLSYFHRCVHELLDHQTGLRAFVFSDDIAWCQEMLKLACPTTYVSHTSAATAHEDLWLMSRCRHRVIPNSSLSWWGAYLAADPHGVTYAPDPWFADPKLGGDDIIPNGWRRVAGKSTYQEAA